MTIRIPPETMLDKILHALGKERQIVLSREAILICNELGLYAQVNGEREGFLSALFRRKAWATKM